MIRRFSKLEFVLGILLIIVVIILFRNNFVGLFRTDESILEHRFISMINLQNNSNYAEIYDKYLDSSVKAKITKNDFVRTSANSKVVNLIPQVNEVIIRDNTGYIDRSLVRCLNQDCTEKKEIRGYTQWFLKNGEWYMTGGGESCIREIPYEKPPEFDRALSLIKQRYADKYGSKVGSPAYFNCLDIQYAQLSDSEGVFTFDENQSNMQKLSIFVDNSYKTKDDILTAFLLSHEIFHAGSYLTALNSGDIISCFDNEIQAFQSSVLFLGSLNEDERDSLISRLSQTDYSENNSLLLIKKFSDFSGKALRVCGGGGDCYAKQMNLQISEMVKTSPYYIEQCKRQD